MKIYILPIDPNLRPEEQPWRYPKHSQPFGVEQDFYQYLQKHPELTTNDPDNADWHYLGVYWTRYHVAHDFGKTGLDEMQSLVNKSIIDDKKTFTICQYDDGPLVNIGQTKQLLAARKTEIGIDIPVVCSPHRIPFFKPAKKYLASFMGADTHEIRKEMIKELKDKPGILIADKKSAREFRDIILSSYVALAPRGYGGSSFRFFEAMQLGVAPFFITDIDTRPFKDQIDYDQFSFFTKNPKEVMPMLQSKTKDELLKMGKVAKKIYADKLAYQKWPELALAALSKVK